MRTVSTSTLGQVQKGLGVASLGLGLFELFAPRRAQRLLGIADHSAHRGILRVLGIREALHGVDLLTAPSRPKEIHKGLKARVAGDILDGALLALAATKTNVPARFALVVAGIGMVVLADVYWLRRTS